jgi:hypothetical protein
MDHKNIRGFQLTAFVPGDDSDNAWAAIVTDANGGQMLLSFPLTVAATIFAQLEAAMKQIAREGADIPVPAIPEKVLRYNAAPLKSDGENLVEILIVGDRSQPLHCFQNQTDARRFSALLSAAAESSGPRRAN